jgi:hypothetical protein
MFLYEKLFYSDIKGTLLEFRYIFYHIRSVLCYRELA